MCRLKYLPNYLNTVFIFQLILRLRLQLQVPTQLVPTQQVPTQPAQQPKQPTQQVPTQLQVAVPTPLQVINNYLFLKIVLISFYTM